MPYTEAIWARPACVPALTLCTGVVTNCVFCSVLEDLTWYFGYDDMWLRNRSSCYGGSSASQSSSFRVDAVPLTPWQWVFETKHELLCDCSARGLLNGWDCDVLAIMTSRCDRTDSKWRLWELWFPCDVLGLRLFTVVHFIFWPINELFDETL